eukprot:s159_g28.t1
MLGRLCCCLAAKKKIVDEPVATKAEEPESEVPRAKAPEAFAEGEVDGCLPGVPEVYDASGLPDLNLESGDGHLSIFELLGRGVSGCRVHRCQSTQIPVPALAGKVLPLGKATFPDMVEDFGKEMEMMKSLPAHDSIVAFHGAWSTECYMDSGVQHKAYVMLLELCSSSLESVIRSRRDQQQPFRAAELLHVLKQVAAGLAHLHRHRVLHRDLKSANIWLSLGRSDSFGRPSASSALPLQGAPFIPEPAGLSLVSSQPRDGDPLPNEALFLVSSLHREDRVARATRAWQAGLQAGAILRGERNYPNSTPFLAVRNRVYVCLLCRGDRTVRYFTSFGRFKLHVGALERTDTVCHGFPTEGECRVYVRAAGGRFPDSSEWN